MRRCFSLKILLAGHSVFWLERCVAKITHLVTSSAFAISLTFQGILQSFKPVLASLLTRLNLAEWANQGPPNYQAVSNHSVYQRLVSQEGEHRQAPAAKLRASLE